MDLGVLGNIILKYLGDHPDVIEKLLHALVTRILQDLEKANSAAK